MVRTQMAKPFEARAKKRVGTGATATAPATTQPTVMGADDMPVMINDTELEFNRQLEAELANTEDQAIFDEKTGQ